MVRKAFIVIMVFVFSACATTQLSTSQFPKVKMEGNRLVEPDYGYSLEIPTGFTLVDEAFLAKLEPTTREKYSDIRKPFGEPFRAMFFNSSQSSFSFVLGARSIYAKKHDAVNASRRSWESRFSAENSQRGLQYFFNIAFDRYERLTDLNASADVLDGARVLAYYSVYNHRGALYELALGLVAPLSNFESCLPTFYSCVKSLDLPDRVPNSEGQQKAPASVRLEKLKELKDRGLI
jgi:hypothetical protein